MRRWPIRRWRPMRRERTGALNWRDWAGRIPIPYFGNSIISEENAAAGVARGDRAWGRRSEEPLERRGVRERSGRPRPEASDRPSEPGRQRAAADLSVRP